MRHRLWLGLGLAATAAAVAATAVAAGSRNGVAAHAQVGAAVAGLAACSKATASEVATRLGVGVDPISGKTPIFQVLCGPFLGPSSRGMVASVAVAAGCGGSIGWAVFRYSGGTWELVMQQRNGAFLAQVGSDIRERVGAPRRGDPRCSPSAWKTRIWHWDGSRFTASAWTVELATLHLDSFVSPDRKVGCAVNWGVGLAVTWCVANPPARMHYAEVRANGAVKLCDPSPADICAQNAVTIAPVLRDGQQNVLRGFRCIAERKGITCTVVAGAGKGKGFVINAAGATRVQP